MISQAVASTEAFEKVTGTHDLFPEVQSLFKEVIEPIYGNQEAALKRIADAEDRTCELLVETVDTVKKVSGLIVYKNDPTDEFKEYGADKALEIKTLFVVNAKENSGRGIGSKLLNRICEVAITPPFESIVVTVSETKQESLQFFKKKQFQQVAVLAGNHTTAPELLLTKKLV